MIVPGNRLLLWVALIGVPGSLIAAVSPGLTLPVICAVGAFLALVLLDAALSMGRLQGVTAAFDGAGDGAEGPALVRMTKDRDTALPLTIQDSHARRRRVRVGIALPPALASPHETMTAVLDGSAETYRMPWPCTPERRGRFLLDSIHIETPSHLGFWRIRAACAATAEVRVYPNLGADRRRLAGIFLNRGGAGLHAQRHVGKGRDFEKLREYMPGDSYEDIHWKATARRARPVTKIYQVERTQEVYVLIDASRLSARTVATDRSGAPVTQLDRFLEAALSLGIVAQKQGDLFGLATFTDTVDRFVRSGTGPAHFNACREALYTLEPRRVNPDFGELFTFLRLRLRRRALLVFLTNLDDPVLAEDFSRNADLLARHHLMLVNMLTPPGVAPLFHNPAIETEDDVYRSFAGHLQWRDLRELQKTMQRHGITMGMRENATLTPELVAQYVSVKQRQLL